MCIARTCPAFPSFYGNSIGADTVNTTIAYALERNLVNPSLEIHVEAHAALPASHE